MCKRTRDLCIKLEIINKLSSYTYLSLKHTRMCLTWKKTTVTLLFLGAFPNLQKATLSSVMSVCMSVYLSVRLSIGMEHLCFHCTDFHKISYFGIFLRICWDSSSFINPLNPELNPICYLLALLGAHYFLHVSRIRDKSLTFRLLMSYIYGAPILDVSRSHTTTHHSR